MLNARGSLTLKYQVADDYGVIGAEANFAKPVLPGGRPAARSLVDPPKIALLLPPAPNLAGEAETTADLAEHPWAGARVEMTLSARDEGGNEGKSDPVEMTLPQKPFVKPLARALVEQRRNLVLAPDDKARVLTALDALMFAPETFDTSASVYLGLRVAFDQLSAAKDDSDLTEVAEYLWQMALRLENGNLSEAERELRAAEEHLREALQRNAPDEEIRKLAENLRGAMDKFLQELAAQQNDKEQENHSAELDGPGRSVNAKELQAMLDKMQDMLRSGDAEGAQKMLEQLQNILENLRVARPRKADPGAQQMTRALDELGRMSQDQQDLRDETYQGNQANRHQQRVQRNPWGQPGQQTFGDFFNHEDGDEDADVGNMDNGDPRALKDPPAQRQSQADLGKRQRALRDRLETLQKKLDESGADPRNLDDAQKAMRQAESALGQGPRGGDDAVNAQGRAIDALREEPRSSLKRCVAKAKQREVKTAREARVKAEWGASVRAMRPIPWVGPEEAKGHSTPARDMIRWGFRQQSGPGACLRSCVEDSASRHVPEKKWIIWNVYCAVIEPCRDAKTTPARSFRRIARLCMRQLT